jgi:SAM-dependent methyltransferase
MSNAPTPSGAPDLTTFTNYEYELDLNGDASAAHLVALVGKNRRVLEIGAGSGIIARALIEENNCEVVALEINPVSVEKLKTFCKSVYSADLNDRNWTSALAAEGKFDVVIAGDVLEHLYDPWTVLKAMKTLINSQGHIFLSLPHAGYKGMLACLAQEDFAYGEWGLLDKTHIRFFGVNNIQALHDNAGLAIEEARFVVRDPDEVEFGARWAVLPESAKRAFSRHKFSSVYQIVTKAAPAERVSAPLRLIDAEPPPTKRMARAAAEEKAKKGQIRLIAFFLTQFHPIPENDEWWGRGFTEWTNVTKTKPLFPGHYQPQLPTELGFYDLRVRQSRRDQIDLAKSYGIDGFCYHYYWFSGRRLLNAPLDDMLADPDSDMPFCICWANENWTRRWDAAEHEVLIAQQYKTDDDLEFIKELAPLFKDKRYIHVDDAPFFVVYRPQHMPDAKKSVALWRDYCASIGIPKIHVACAFTHGNWDYEQFGFDSGVEFPPHNMVKASIAPGVNFLDDFEGYLFDMADVAELYLERSYSNDYNGFRGVFPSWDNTARRGAAASLGLNGTPRNYEYWLSQAVAKTREDFPGQDRLVFINAWNEWAEGCHLEPCRNFGRQFLEATLRAKNGMSRETGFVDRGIPAIARIPEIVEEAPAPDFFEEAPPLTQAPAHAPRKKYSHFGLMLRKKVRNPIRAVLRRVAGRPAKPD